MFGKRSARSLRDGPASKRKRNGAAILSTFSDMPTLLEDGPEDDDVGSMPLITMGPYKKPAGYAPPLTPSCYPLPWNVDGSQTLREVMDHLNYVVPKTKPLQVPESIDEEVSSVMETDTLSNASPKSTSPLLSAASSSGTQDSSPDHLNDIVPTKNSLQVPEKIEEELVSVMMESDTLSNASPKSTSPLLSAASSSDTEDSSSDHLNYVVPKTKPRQVPESNKEDLSSLMEADTVSNTSQSTISPLLSAASRTEDSSSDSTESAVSPTASEHDIPTTAISISTSSDRQQLMEQRLMAWLHDYSVASPSPAHSVEQQLGGLKLDVLDP